MKILIVDDSKAMRMIVRRSILRSPGYADAEIIEATNGREGLDAATAESPDVILSDWNMPEMTGIEFLDELREQGPLPPFGFVTSESTPEMYERATRSGARFLVTKPFTPDTLAASLDSVV